MSFGDAEYAAEKKTPRREVSLAEMHKVVRWKSPLKVIAPSIIRQEMGRST